MHRSHKHEGVVGRALDTQPIAALMEVRQLIDGLYALLGAPANKGASCCLRFGRGLAKPTVAQNAEDAGCDLWAVRAHPGCDGAGVLGGGNVDDDVTALGRERLVECASPEPIEVACAVDARRACISSR